MITDHGPLKIIFICSERIVFLNKWIHTDLDSLLQSLVVPGQHDDVENSAHDVPTVTDGLPGHDKPGDQFSTMSSLINEGTVGMFESTWALENHHPLYNAFPNAVGTPWTESRTAYINIGLIKQAISTRRPSSPILAGTPCLGAYVSSDSSSPDEETKPIVTLSQRPDSRLLEDSFTLREDVTVQADCSHHSVSQNIPRPRKLSKRPAKRIEGDFVRNRAK